MAIPLNRKFRNSLEGVLAAGGNAATTPLYAFGPVLRLLAVATLGQVAFGASIWLAVLSLLVAAALYRLVIAWMPNGRGGTGLSEEEFGGWSIRINAALTTLEYTLTFLVSIAAAVTVLADRLPSLDGVLFLGIQGRDLVAAGLALLIAWLVNNTPGSVAKSFGPATASVVALLWLMIAATVLQRGIHLPIASPAAFHSDVLFRFTLAGWARLLVVLAGVQVFATLPPAYAGGQVERSRKAFGSLLFVVATSALVLLIVGPAMPGLARPGDGAISAFGQAMDRLLPGPLALIGSLVAIAGLLAVAAASAQGLQNLALGLSDRNFAPAFLGQRNRNDVPSWPVWIAAGLAALCYLAVNSREQTYVVLYAAGVLALMSLTAWAAVKRAASLVRHSSGAAHLLLAGAVLLLALWLTAAALVTFVAGFTTGAWLYLIFVPLLFVFFHFTRRRLGSPNPLREELGRREETMWGLGMSPRTQGPGRRRLPAPVLVPAQDGADRGALARWEGQPAAIGQVIVALDGSPFAERALPTAIAICQVFGASLALVSVLPARGVMRVLPKGRSSGNPPEAGQVELETYLSQLAGRARSQGVVADYFLAAGQAADGLNTLLRELDADLLVMSTHGRSGIGRFMLGSVANAVVQLASRPVMLLRPEGLDEVRAPQVRNVLVTLDGSSVAEQVLPYAQAVAAAGGSEIILLSVPEVPDEAAFGALYDLAEELREQAEANARRYLQEVAARLQAQGANVRAVVTGSQPATTILELAEQEHVDLIMLATHGRGGIERLVMGSVADRIVHHATCPVLLVPVRVTR